MRKIIALLLVVGFVLAFSSVAFADGRLDSKAWVVDKDGDRITHFKNDQLKFWVDGDRAGEIVIPSDANLFNNSPIFRDESMSGQSNIYPPGHMEKYSD